MRNIFTNGLLQGGATQFRPLSSNEIPLFLGLSMALLTFAYLGLLTLGQYEARRCERLNDRDQAGQCKQYVVVDSIAHWWSGD